MQNLHRHSSYSNLFTSADSSASNEDYAKRAVELGHRAISSVEHGWQGYYHQTFELAKQYNLKCVIGTEAYWVKDRFEKDRGNHHILLLAKSNQGREAINDVLSEANLTGYYYRPRIDLPLLMSLPPKDILVTSACIAFNGYEDIDNIVLQLHEHFKDNFMLEMQYHNTDKQKNWNRHLLELSKKYGIELFAGLDSHYILPEEAAERDYLLDAKDIHYPDEEGWYMDYPSDEDIRDRFLKQGILSSAEITQAMNNTDVCLDFCDYDKVRVFMNDIKLPSLYPDETQEQKNKRYSRLISKKFKEYTKGFSKEEYDRYFEGVKSEVQTYKDTGMVDYPMIDYEIVKEAKAMGGLITDTGRGSAVGYFTNTLCGFSSVDRFKSDIKLYPERFISTTRILETRSLPDIDMNVGNVEIFEQAQKKVLGKAHAYPMIAFGTLKKKSAFKIYAKANGLNFDLANEISQQITKYDEAVKQADEEDKDSIDLYDFVDRKYEKYIEESKKYWGVISDRKKAPSAYLLYDGDIRKEIGLIKCKSESTGKECVTCVIDGAIAENYKFLKNDLLKVDVVLLIDKVFKRIGIKHFGVNELLEKVKGDSKVWSLYANGYTIGLNQVEQDGSRHKCMNYKPHNVSELSAFVAAIRPGFKSMYSRFEKREDFSWGIPSLDNLLRTEELPVSFLFFQEQVMSVLNYAGFPMDVCYGAIKSIAKKHPEKVKPLKEQFIPGFKERLINEDNLSEDIAQKTAEDVWNIVNDNCGYGFNCVSGETKIIRGASNGHYVPTIEEMYKIRHDYQYAKESGHLALHKKYKTTGYGQALSLCEDGRLRPNRIVSIKPSGIRQTYTVLTKNGCNITCTDNHKFPTQEGEKKLSELKLGDFLYCFDGYGKKKFDATLTDGNFVKNYPSKGQCGFQENENGASVIYDMARNKYVLNKAKCECCGKKYSEDERFEVHHKDFNRHNNSFDNYSWLCASCHKKIHYKNGRTKRYENGIGTYFDEIIAIYPCKIEQVYDVEMDDPYHTFVTDSGLVTSNSAHAYCMACDSLYQAWQKAHYPYEFYEVLLNHYSEKGNKDKVLKLKQEMRKAFGIKEGTYGFRNNHIAFSADEVNGVIYPALSAIKGVSKSVAEELYKLRNNQYDDFIALLIDIYKLKINSKQLDIFIKMNMFSEFGEINELLQQRDVFHELYGSKQIKFEKWQYDSNILRECAGKCTEKMAKDFDSVTLIRRVIDSLEPPETTPFDKVKYEKEFIGYISTTIPDIVDDCYYVTGTTGYNNKTLILYNLKTGETLTIKNRTKKQKAPKEDDIIRITEMENTKKYKPLGKDEKGKMQFERIDEYETVLTGFSFVNIGGH